MRRFVFVALLCCIAAPAAAQVTTIPGQMGTVQRPYHQLFVSGQTVTGSGTDSAVSVAASWNSTAAPTAFKVNVTDTASASAALVADYWVNGSSVFRVRKDGAVTAVGSLVGASVYAASGGKLYVSSRGSLSASADGAWALKKDDGATYGTLAVAGLHAGTTAGCTGTPTAATGGIATTCTGPEAAPDQLLAMIQSLTARIAALEAQAGRQ